MSEMDEATRKSVLRKIKACLARAESSNPHEAETALRQAHAMMAKHRVSMLDTEVMDVSTHDVDSGTSRLPSWMASLASSVGEIFGCRPMLVRSVLGRSCCVRFVGVGAASELAGYAYASLVTQHSVAKRAYLSAERKAGKPTSKAVGQSFTTGWVLGVRNLVVEFASTNHEGAGLNALTVVRQRENAAIGKWMAVNIGRPKVRRVNLGAADDCAQASGYAAGSAAQIRQGLSAAGGA